MNEYYVYTLIDPRDGSVFYIGKGKGDRVLHHYKELEKFIDFDNKGIPASKGRFSNLNKTFRMKQIRDSGCDTQFEKLIENVSEDSAHVLEEVLIERIGRKVLKSGPLLNLEPGGKWKYPKIVLSEKEKTPIETIKEKFPELLSIIEKTQFTALFSELEKKILKDQETNID